MRWFDNRFHDALKSSECWDNIFGKHKVEEFLEGRKNQMQIPKCFADCIRRLRRNECNVRREWFHCERTCPIEWLCSCRDISSKPNSLRRRLFAICFGFRSCACDRARVRPSLASPDWCYGPKDEGGNLSSSIWNEKSMLLHALHVCLVIRDVRAYCQQTQKQETRSRKIIVWLVASWTLW